MRETTVALNDLIEVTRDALRFCADAAAHVREPRLKAALRAMVDAKDRLISALSEQVRMRGAAPSAAQTAGGALRRTYAQIRAGVGDADAAYVVQLEDAEARLLAAFERAADAAGDEPLRRAIAEHLPQLRRSHEEMRDLKKLAA